MISDLAASYWRRAVASTSVSTTSLGVFRWVFGLFQLIWYVPNTAWLEHIPSGLFDPPEFSIAYLVGGFPPAPFFTVIDIIAVLALVAMTVGWRTRTATLVVVACRLIGTSFFYSFGKIDHTDLMLTWLLLALAFSSWGERYTLRDAWLRRTVDDVARNDDASPGESTVALAVFATVLSFGLFTAGIVKLRGWIDFDLSTSGVRRWFYPNRDMLDRNGLLAPLVPGTPSFLLELGDYLAVAMELTAFAFLLIERRLWLVYLAVLTTFHFANLLVLNIPFPAQVMTYLVFVGLAAPRIGDPRRWILPAAGVAGVAAVWNVGRRIGGSSALTVLPGGQPDQAQYLLYIAMFVYIGVLAALLLELRRLKARRTPAAHTGSPPAQR